MVFDFNACCIVVLNYLSCRNLIVIDSLEVSYRMSDLNLICTGIKHPCLSVLIVIGSHTIGIEGYRYLIAVSGSDKLCLCIACKLNGALFNSARIVRSREIELYYVLACIFARVRNLNRYRNLIAVSRIICYLPIKGSIRKTVSEREKNSVRSKGLKVSVAYIYALCIVDKILCNLIGISKVAEVCGCGII